MAAQLNLSRIRKPEVSMKQQVLNDVQRRRNDKSDEINKIQKMVGYTKPVRGTTVEKYLNTRGIYKPLPDDIRCQISKKHGPSMVAIVRSHDGQITGIQRTRLDPMSNDKVSDGPAKISQVCIFGSSVLIQKGNCSTVFLAEGVETALSLREAGVDGEIRAVLGMGNLLNVGLTLANNRHIVLVADNDGKLWEEDQSFVRAVNTLKESGYNVNVMFPARTHHKEKIDFNDVLLLDEGKEDILRQSKSIDKPHKTIIPERASLEL